MLSVEKLEARAHQLELCKARGNLIATETEVSPQLEYIQKLWGHLKQCGNLRVSELLFAVKLQVIYCLLFIGKNGCVFKVLYKETRSVCILNFYIHEFQVV